MGADGMEYLMEKKILDVTCGSRTIWFNKTHPAAIYADSRKVITKKLIDPSVSASYYLTQRKEKKLSLVAEEFWKYATQIHK